MKLAERVKRRRRCSEVAETDLEIDAPAFVHGKGAPDIQKRPPELVNANGRRFGLRDGGADRVARCRLHRAPS